MVQNLRAYFTLLCYHNQIYKIYTGKDWIFLHVKKTKVDRNHNFRSLLGYNGKATVKNCKKLLRGGKRMASCCPGVSFATPSLRACNQSPLVEIPLVPPTATCRDLEPSAL